jgi:hypothetical protein
MRGSFRGMFRFGCGSAYGSHSYSVLPPSIGGDTADDNQYRSYLYSLISQASAPRQKEETRMTTTMNEIYPGVRVGEQSWDVAIIVVAFGIVFTVGLGSCYLLGWIIDSNARAARLQLAQEYAAQHLEQPVQLDGQAVAQQQLIAQQYMQQPQVVHNYATPPMVRVRTYVPQQYGTAHGAAVYPQTYAMAPQTVTGPLRNDQVYMYWR